MRLTLSWLITLLAFACPLNAQTPKPAHEGLADAISSWIAPLHASGQLSGTLLMAVGDTVVFEKAFGKSDYGLDVVNTTATRFSIASVTKPLTQLVLFGLMAEEKLEDGPVSRWIPQFPQSERITLMNLATHRAGIPHRVTTPADEVKPQTAESMTALASHAGFLSPPGTERSYSSAGYSVLARVLEIAGGEEYSGLLRRYVTAPAGAVHTTDAEPRSIHRAQARGYFFGTTPIPAPPRDLSFLVGAGSVISTPRDLFLIQRALISGRYGEAAREQMVGKSGLRWNGYTNGYRAFADYYSEDDTSVIFTGNLFTGSADLLRSEIPKIARGETVPQPAVPSAEALPMSAADQARASGSYRLGSADQVLEFASPVLATLGDWILIPTSKDTFFSPQDYAKVTVVADEQGVKGLQWGEGPMFPRSSGADDESKR